MSKDGIELSKAAEILGVSKESLRKRVQRGSIEAYKQDNRWYVVIDESMTQHDAVQDDMDTPYTPDNDLDNTQETLIDTLKDEIDFLRGELNARSEEIRRKDHIIAALAQRIPDQTLLAEQSEAREKRAEERDRTLLETLRLMQESRKEIAATQNRSFLSRLFGK